MLYVLLKMQRYSTAILLPVIIQTAVILLRQTPFEGLLKTSFDFSMVLLFITFGIGLLILIPTTLVQILTARALVKSNQSDRALFFIGLMNPSISIILILFMGYIYSLANT